MKILEEKIAELGHLTDQCLKNNEVAMPELGSYLGKAMNIACGDLLGRHPMLSTCTTRSRSRTRRGRQAGPLS